MMSKISCFVTRSRPLLLLALLALLALLSPTLDTFSSKVNIGEGVPVLLLVVLLPTGLRKEAKVVRVEEMGAVKEESFNLCTVGLRFLPDICAKLVGLSCLLPVLDGSALEKKFGDFGFWS